MCSDYVVIATIYILFIFSTIVITFIALMAKKSYITRQIYSAQNYPWIQLN